MDPIILGAAIVAVALAAGKSAPASQGTTGPNADSEPNYSKPDAVNNPIGPGKDAVSVAGENGGTLTVKHDGAGPIATEDTGNTMVAVSRPAHVPTTPVHTPSDADLRRTQIAVGTATAAEGAAGFGPAALGLQLVASQYTRGLTKKDQGKVVSDYGPAAGAVW